MDTINAINQVILDPRYHDYLAILKGARNGIVYGAKVRFPHALVMAILFGRGECVCRGTWGTATVINRMNTAGRPAPRPSCARRRRTR
jgi:hypothetical protein